MQPQLTGVRVCLAAQMAQVGVRAAVSVVAFHVVRQSARRKEHLWAQLALKAHHMSVDFVHVHVERVGRLELGAAELTGEALSPMAPQVVCEHLARRHGSITHWTCEGRGLDAMRPPHVTPQTRRQLEHHVANGTLVSLSCGRLVSLFFPTVGTNVKALGVWRRKGKGAGGTRPRVMLRMVQVAVARQTGGRGHHLPANVAPYRLYAAILLSYLALLCRLFVLQEGYEERRMFPLHVDLQCLLGQQSDATHWTLLPSRQVHAGVSQQISTHSLAAATRVTSAPQS